MLPVTAVAPIEVDLPLQMDTLDPAAAAGNAFTVTVTLFDKLQPVAVMVSVMVYTVVTDGVTVGFDEVELNPDGLLDQEYVSPVTAVLPMPVLLLRQIAVFDPALAAGAAFTVYVVEVVSSVGKLSLTPFGRLDHTFTLAVPAANV